MKTIIILTMSAIFFIVLLNFVEPFQINSSSYDTSLYFGAGGYAESTATLDVGAGIGQITIGEISIVTYSVAIQYGIFWINVSYSVPPALFPSIGIYIEDFGIEWIKLNWT